MKGEIFLRPLTVEDASVSWRWRNDAHLWRFTASRPDRYITEEMEKAWAEKAIADKTRLNFAICLTASKRYIGNIYLVNIKDGQGDLGIFIGDKTCHGKGYAKQAIEILKGIAQRELGLQTIKIEVNAGNIPALVSYLKSGASLAGEDQWMDLFIDLSQKYAVIPGGGVIVQVSTFYWRLSEPIEFNYHCDRQIHNNLRRGVKYGINWQKSNFAGHRRIGL